MEWEKWGKLELDKMVQRCWVVGAESDTNENSWWLQFGLALTINFPPLQPQIMSPCYPFPDPTGTALAHLSPSTLTMGFLFQVTSHLNHSNSVAYLPIFYHLQSFTRHFCLSNILCLFFKYKYLLWHLCSWSSLNHLLDQREIFDNGF